MDSIRIDSGVKRVCINDDPERVIAFNPSDVGFAERFFELYRDLLRRSQEFEQRAAALDANEAVGADGLPANVTDKLAFQREVIDYVHGQIDRLFGEGTAETVFQGARSIDAIVQFFEGLTPLVQQVREEKTRKYRKPTAARGGRVMK